MKLLLVLLLFFCNSRAFGQTIDSLLAGRNLPPHLSASVKNENGSFPDFPVGYTSIVTFKSGSASVDYFIFPYRPADSAAFKKAENNYWMISGCNMDMAKDADKNLSSFIKGTYYFLLQRCSCRPGTNKVCAALAKRINQWKGEFR